MEGETVSLARNVYIAAPAEEVWDWLVEPERTRQYSLCYLAEKPSAVGASITYRSTLGGHVVVEGVVEELIPGRKLVHTYQFQEQYPEPPSRVTLELLRYGDAMCCLQLRHEGMVPGGSTIGSVSTSWDVILSSLKTFIETGRPLPWPARGSASRG
jgi:uncharacterized protein YndB with AHSA1/START domain